MDLTDKQWELIKPFFEWSSRQKTERRGRWRRDARQVFEGILYILRTGAPWHDLPPRYGPFQTCHRRFQQWVREGILDGVLGALAEDLLARGQLDLSESFIDGSFIGAKKGALQLVQQSAAKGARSWQLQTAMVFLSPLGLRVLRRMNVDSLKRRSAAVSSRPTPSA